MMTVSIREVTKENVKEILSLRVSDHQKSYIEASEQSLEDAKDCTFYRPAGLYWEHVLIGFAMYGFFPGEGHSGRVWLDRFMIDENFQGQGFGKMMLTALIEHIVNLYHCKEIYLSLYEDNHRALYLYQKFGFRFNGGLDINGEKVMVKELSGLSAYSF